MREHDGRIAVLEWNRIDFFCSGISFKRVSVFYTVTAGNKLFVKVLMTLL